MQRIIYKLLLILFIFSPSKSFTADFYRVALPNGKMVNIPYFYINNNEYISLIDATKQILPLSIHLNDNHEILYKNCVLYYQPGSFFIYAKINGEEKAAQMSLPVLLRNGTPLIHLKSYFTALQTLGIYECEFYRYRAILRNLLVDKKPEKKLLVQNTQEKKNIPQKKSKHEKVVLSNTELASTFMDTTDYKQSPVKPIKSPKEIKPKPIAEKKKAKISVDKKVQMADNYMSSSTKRMSFLKNTFDPKDTNKTIEIPMDEHRPESGNEPLKTDLNISKPLESNITDVPHNSSDDSEKSSVASSKQLYPPSYYTIPKKLKRKEIDKKLEGQK